MLLFEVVLSKISIEKVRVLLKKCVLIHIQGVVFTTAMVLNVDIFVDMNLVNLVQIYGVWNRIWLASVIFNQMETIFLCLFFSS